MKLKISDIKSLGGNPYLEPEDNFELFKHCSGGAVAIEVGKILPVINLIEIHGEKVDTPFIEMPESHTFIRRDDGERYVKAIPNCHLYYRAGSMEIPMEDGGWEGYEKERFNLIYFDYE